MLLDSLVDLVVKQMQKDLLLVTTNHSAGKNMQLVGVDQEKFG